MADAELETLLAQLEAKIRENVAFMEPPESMRDLPVERLVRAAHQQGSRWKGADYVRQAWLDYASVLYRASLPVVRFEFYRAEPAAAPAAGRNNPGNKIGAPRAAAPESRAPAPPSPPPPRHDPPAPRPQSDDDDLLY